MDLTNPQIIMRDKENARLREELEKWTRVFGHLGTADECGNEWIALQEQLATAQATLEQMREKSEAAKNACMVASSGCSHIKTHAECNEARQFAHATKINVETSLSALNEALSVPPNLDALHEAMDKEREECAAICDRFYERGMNPAECAGAIRAASAVYKSRGGV